MREGYLLMALAAHLIIFTVLAFDLFSTSKRQGKFLWMFFLLFLPVISVLVYQLSMKRKKRTHLFR
jgi:hypothetical protein